MKVVHATRVFKWWTPLLALWLMLVTVNSASAERYRVYLTFVDYDVYLLGSGGQVLLTWGCTTITYGDAAVLIYEPYARDNRVVFPFSGEVCPVAAVRRSNSVLTQVRDDVYRDESSGRIVRTQLCLAMALSEDALVLDDKVVFLHSHEVCSR